MAKLFIKGGYSVNGEIWVSGNKNAGLPIIGASEVFLKYQLKQ